MRGTPYRTLCTVHFRMGRLPLTPNTLEGGDKPTAVISKHNLLPHSLTVLPCRNQCSTYCGCDPSQIYIVMRPPNSVISPACFFSWTIAQSKQTTLVHPSHSWHTWSPAPTSSSFLSRWTHWAISGDCCSKATSTLQVLKSKPGQKQAKWEHVSRQDCKSLGGLLNHWCCI